MPNFYIEKLDANQIQITAFGGFPETPPTVRLELFYLEEAFINPTPHPNLNPNQPIEFEIRGHFYNTNQNDPFLRAGHTKYSASFHYHPLFGATNDPNPPQDLNQFVHAQFTPEPVTGQHPLPKFLPSSQLVGSLILFNKDGIEYLMRDVGASGNVFWSKDAYKIPIGNWFVVNDNTIIESS